MKTASLLVLALVAACSSDTGAQVRASEAGSVSQTVDGTVITVSYSRPQARGRSPLFGEIVDFGDVWTPGANWATTLEVSKNVRINGSELGEGKYSMWMIPNEGEWALFFDARDRRFHTQRPDPSDAVLRLTVKPDSIAHTEVLTWGFPAVRRDGTTLEMRWGSTRIALDIAVESTGRGRFAGSGEAYVGTYRVRFVNPEGGGESREQSVNVYEREDVLYMKFSRAPFPDVDSEIVLQSAGEHRFSPAFQKDGQIFDVERDATVVFTIENGKASGFELQGLEGRTMARGVRQQ